MDFQLLPLSTEDMAVFKKDMQEAFQQGAAKELDLGDTVILPEKDIDESLSNKGAAAYKAVVDGEILGGAIVVIDEETQHNHLDFLYVKFGTQSKGVGQMIWSEIEKLYPRTKVWETCTPYFEKRNIHFYINRLGFHAVEFFNPHHKEPRIPDDMVGGDYFFRFEKVMEQGLKPSGRTIREVCEQAQKEFFEANGYYPTEEDAVRLTDEARQEIEAEKKQRLK